MKSTRPSQTSSPRPWPPGPAMPERSAASRSLAAANGQGAEGGVPAVTARLAVPGAAKMRLLGNRLARLLRAGDLVVLTGSLGAGKTTLVQGPGEALPLRGPVTSPPLLSPPPPPPP